jgi:hypothetical protein
MGAFLKLIFGAFGNGSRFNMEGSGTPERIRAGNQKTFREESHMTPQNFFGQGRVRDRENL